MNGVPIGYCSITVTDAAARIGTVGVYLGDVKSRSTAAAMYFIHILNHVFFALGLNKVVNQIMSGNERLRRAQLLTGYREVGVLRDHLRKGDSLQDVHIFEQTRDEWTRFRKKYRDWRDLDGIEWI